MIAIALIVAILALGFGIVYGVAQTFGGISVDLSIFWGFVLVAIVIGVLAFFGRRRQKRAQAQRAEQIASGRADARGVRALHAGDAEPG